MFSTFNEIVLNKQQKCFEKERMSGILSHEERVKNMSDRDSKSDVISDYN